MRALIDTNVLISAALNPLGAPRAIFDRWLRDEFVLVTSDAALSELAEVLHRPRVQRYRNWTTQQYQEAAYLMRVNGLVVDPAEVVGFERDVKDVHVLGAALAGEADSIVTGDKDLLEPKSSRASRL